MTDSKIIDTPEKNDNRKYDYSAAENFQRDEYPIISEIVEEGSKILDLGCGNGSLLKLLKDEKKTKGFGIDISESGVEACKSKGIEAKVGVIDTKLSDFQDNQFDYAICNVTIQMVNYPEILLAEMARVSKKQIISFPNFAYWKNRLDLLFRGRMPQPMMFGYTWFNTGHIHQLSYIDFLGLVKICNIEINKTIFELKAKKSDFDFKDNIKKIWPNLGYSHCICICSKE